MNKIKEMIEKEYANTTGILVKYKGKDVYEEYFHGCHEDTSMHIFSVTKSIVGLLLGIALKENKIKSIEEPLLSFFPDYEIKPHEKVLQNVRIKDLITMTVPYRHFFSPYKKYFMAENQVKFALDEMGGRRGKIGQFRYAPLIGPDILSAILSQVTGMSVKDYAQIKLFEPLGISYKNDIVFNSKEEQMDYYKRMDLNGWVHDGAGNYNAGWGLHLTLKEMLAIGEMMLGHGIYDGKEIVPEEWIIESTSAKIKPKKMPCAYGYLWWVLDEKERIYAALGDGGSTIYVNETKELVVVTHGLFVPKAKDRIDLIKKVIEPHLDKFN